MVFVNEKECVGCGICFCFCPSGAIDGLGVMKVDQDTCIECLECIEVCPVDALEVQ